MTDGNIHQKNVFPSVYCMPPGIITVCVKTCFNGGAYCSELHLFMTEKSRCNGLLTKRRQMAMRFAVFYRPFCRLLQDERPSFIERFFKS